MVALTIRKDRTAVALRRLAKSESDARVSRRLLAIANALSGMDRKTAAEAAGMDRQALRDWIIRSPLPQNRIHYDGGRVVLSSTLTNQEAHKRLRQKLSGLCDKLEIHPHLFDRSLYLGQNVPIGGTAHQAGTLCFGTDPAQSVLDLNCRAHEVDNPYVTDASFFPSIGAVNPTLTIIANALRVGDEITSQI